LSTEDRWIALAEVARPHGVRGELKLKVYNPDSAVLMARPEIRLAYPDGRTESAVIRGVRRQPNALLLRLDGVSGREAADALRGVRVEVMRSILEQPEDDEFYVCDLIGCQVFLAGASYGTIKDVASYPTCDALVVVRSDGSKLEVPLQGDRVGDVDVADGRVELLNIEGLA